MRGFRADPAIDDRVCFDTLGRAVRQTSPLARLRLCVRRRDVENTIAPNNLPGASASGFTSRAIQVARSRSSATSSSSHSGGSGRRRARMFDRHHGTQRRKAGRADAEGTGSGTHMPRSGRWTWQLSRGGCTSSRCTRWRQFPREWVAGSGRRVAGALCVGCSQEGIRARSRIESRTPGGSLPSWRLRPNATKFGTDCQWHSAVHSTMCWRADGYRGMGRRSWRGNEAHGSIERQYGGNVVQTSRTRFAE